MFQGGWSPDVSSILLRTIGATASRPTTLTLESKTQSVSYRVEWLECQPSAVSQLITGSEAPALGRGLEARPVPVELSASMDGTRQRIKGMLRIPSGDHS